MDPVLVSGIVVGTVAFVSILFAILWKKARKDKKTEIILRKPHPFTKGKYIELATEENLYGDNKNLSNTPNWNLQYMYHTDKDRKTKIPPYKMPRFTTEKERSNLEPKNADLTKRCKYKLHAKGRQMFAQPSVEVQQAYAMASAIDRTVKTHASGKKGVTRREAHAECLGHNSSPVRKLGIARTRVFHSPKKTLRSQRRSVSVNTDRRATLNYEDKDTMRPKHYRCSAASLSQDDMSEKITRLQSSKRQSYTARNETPKSANKRYAAIATSTPIQQQKVKHVASYSPDPVEKYHTDPRMKLIFTKVPDQRYEVESIAISPIKKPVFNRFPEPTNSREESKPEKTTQKEDELDNNDVSKIKDVKMNLRDQRKASKKRVSLSEALYGLQDFSPSVNERSVKDVVEEVKRHCRIESGNTFYNADYKQQNEIALKVHQMPRGILSAQKQQPLKIANNSSESQTNTNAEVDRVLKNDKSKGTQSKACLSDNLARTTEVPLNKHNWADSENDTAENKLAKSKISYYSPANSSTASSHFESTPTREQESLCNKTTSEDKDNLQDNGQLPPPPERAASFQSILSEFPSLPSIIASDDNKASTDGMPATTSKFVGPKIINKNNDDNLKSKKLPCSVTVESAGAEDSKRVDRSSIKVVSEENKILKSSITRHSTPSKQSSTSSVHVGDISPDKTLIPVAYYSKPSPDTDSVITYAYKTVLLHSSEQNRGPPTAAKGTPLIDADEEKTESKVFCNKDSNAGSAPLQYKNRKTMVSTDNDHELKAPRSTEKEKLNGRESSVPIKAYETAASSLIVSTHFESQVNSEAKSKHTETTSPIISQEKEKSSTMSKFSRYSDVCGQKVLTGKSSLPAKEKDSTVSLEKDVQKAGQQLAAEDKICRRLTPPKRTKTEVPLNKSIGKVEPRCAANERSYSTLMPSQVSIRRSLPSANNKMPLSSVPHQDILETSLEIATEIVKPSSATNEILYSSKIPLSTAKQENVDSLVEAIGKTKPQYIRDEKSYSRKIQSQVTQHRSPSPSADHKRPSSPILNQDISKGSTGKHIEKSRPHSSSKGRLYLRKPPQLITGHQKVESDDEPKEQQCTANETTYSNEVSQEVQNMKTSASQCNAKEESYSRKKPPEVIESKRHSPSADHRRSLLDVPDHEISVASLVRDIEKSKPQSTVKEISLTRKPPLSIIGNEIIDSEIEKTRNTEPLCTAKETLFSRKYSSPIADHKETPASVTNKNKSRPQLTSKDISHSEKPKSKILGHGQEGLLIGKNTGKTERRDIKEMSHIKDMPSQATNHRISPKNLDHKRPSSDQDVPTTTTEIKTEKSMPQFCMKDISVTRKPTPSILGHKNAESELERTGKAEPQCTVKESYSSIEIQTQITERIRRSSHEDDKILQLPISCQGISDTISGTDGEKPMSQFVTKDTSSLRKPPSHITSHGDEESVIQNIGQREPQLTDKETSYSNDMPVEAMKHKMLISNADIKEHLSPGPKEEICVASLVKNIEKTSELKDISNTRKRTSPIKESENIEPLMKIVGKVDLERTTKETHYRKMPQKSKKCRRRSPSADHKRSVSPVSYQYNSEGKIGIDIERSRSEVENTEKTEPECTAKETAYSREMSPLVLSRTIHSATTELMKPPSFVSNQDISAARIEPEKSKLQSAVRETPAARKLPSSITAQKYEKIVESVRKTESQITAKDILYSRNHQPQLTKSKGCSPSEPPSLVSVEDNSDTFNDTDSEGSRSLIENDFEKTAPPWYAKETTDLEETSPRGISCSIHSASTEHSTLQSPVSNQDISVGIDTVKESPQSTSKAISDTRKPSSPITAHKNETSAAENLGKTEPQITAKEIPPQVMKCEGLSPSEDRKTPLSPVSFKVISEGSVGTDIERSGSEMENFKTTEPKCIAKETVYSGELSPRVISCSMNSANADHIPPPSSISNQDISIRIDTEQLTPLSAAKEDSIKPPSPITVRANEKAIVENLRKTEPQITTEETSPSKKIPPQVMKRRRRSPSADHKTASVPVLTQDMSVASLVRDIEKSRLLFIATDTSFTKNPSFPIIGHKNIKPVEENIVKPEAQYATKERSYSEKIPPQVTKRKRHPSKIDHKIPVSPVSVESLGKDMEKSRMHFTGLEKVESVEKNIEKIEPACTVDENIYARKMPPKVPKRRNCSFKAEHERSPSPIPNQEITNYKDEVLQTISETSSDQLAVVNGSSNVLKIKDNGDKVISLGAEIAVDRQQTSARPQISLDSENKTRGDRSMTQIVAQEFRRCIADSNEASGDLPDNNNTLQEACMLPSPITVYENVDSVQKDTGKTAPQYSDKETSNLREMKSQVTDQRTCSQFADYKRLTSPLPNQDILDYVDDLLQTISGESSDDQGAFDELLHVTKTKERSNQYNEAVPNHSTTQTSNIRFSHQQTPTPLQSSFHLCKAVTNEVSDGSLTVYHDSNILNPALIPEANEALTSPICSPCKDHKRPQSLVPNQDISDYVDEVLQIISGGASDDDESVDEINQVPKLERSTCFQSSHLSKLASTEIFEDSSDVNNICNSDDTVQVPEVNNILNDADTTPKYFSSADHIRPSSPFPNQDISDYVDDVLQTISGRQLDTWSVVDKSSRVLKTKQNDESYDITTEKPATVQSSDITFSQTLASLQSSSCIQEQINRKRPVFLSASQEHHSRTAALNEVVDDSSNVHRYSNDTESDKIPRNNVKLKAALMSLLPITGNTRAESDEKDIKTPKPQCSAREKPSSRNALPPVAKRRRRSPNRDHERPLSAIPTQEVSDYVDDLLQVISGESSHEHGLKSWDNNDRATENQATIQSSDISFISRKTLTTPQGCPDSKKQFKRNQSEARSDMRQRYVNLEPSTEDYSNIPCTANGDGRAKLPDISFTKHEALTESQSIANGTSYCRKTPPPVAKRRRRSQSTDQERPLPPDPNQEVSDYVDDLLQTISGESSQDQVEHDTSLQDLKTSETNKKYNRASENHAIVQSSEILSDRQQRHLNFGTSSENYTNIFSTSEDDDRVKVPGISYTFHEALTGSQSIANETSYCRKTPPLVAKRRRSPSADHEKPLSPDPNQEVSDYVDDLLQTISGESSHEQVANDSSSQDLKFWENKEKMDRVTENQATVQSSYITFRTQNTLTVPQRCSDSLKQIKRQQPEKYHFSKNKDNPNMIGTSNDDDRTKLPDTGNELHEAPTESQSIANERSHYRKSPPPVTKRTNRSPSADHKRPPSPVPNQEISLYVDEFLQTLSERPSFKQGASYSALQASKTGNINNKYGQTIVEQTTTQNSDIVYSPQRTSPPPDRSSDIPKQTDNLSVIRAVMQKRQFHVTDDNEAFFDSASVLSDTEVQDAAEIPGVRNTMHEDLTSSVSDIPIKIDKSHNIAADPDVKSLIKEIKAKRSSSARLSQLLLEDERKLQKETTVQNQRPVKAISVRKYKNSDAK